MTYSILAVDTHGCGQGRKACARGFEEALKPDSRARNVLVPAMLVLFATRAGVDVVREAPNAPLAGLHA